MDGKSGQVLVMRQGADEAEVYYKADAVALEPGDAVCVEAGGGGGYGLPTERPVEDVALDVRRGFVSPTSALRDYRVVMTPDGLATRIP